MWNTNSTLRANYSLCLFIPDPDRYNIIKQLVLAEYVDYIVAKESCLRYRKTTVYTPVVVDWSGNVCYPYEQSIEIKE